MLVESKFVNHNVEVHDDGKGVYVRLIDESGGIGEILDETGEITEKDGTFMAPLRSGGATACSAEEVVYLLSKLPLTVHIPDQWGEASIAVSRSRMPASDEDRLAFLTAGREQMREVERDMEEYRSKPPAWYVALKEVWGEPGRSLFP